MIVYTPPKAAGRSPIVDLAGTFSGDPDPDLRQRRPQYINEMFRRACAALTPDLGGA